MAADQTLVRAAFTEASTRYGGDVLDQSRLYESTKNISAQYGKVISGALKIYNDRKEKKRIGVDAQLNAFKSIAESQLQKLYNEESPLDNKIINAIERRIEELQEDFEKVNYTGKEDTKQLKRERRRILGELNRITSNAIGLRGNMQLFMENAKDIDYNMIHEPELLRFATDVIDLDNYSNRDDIIVNYGDKGIEFTISGNTITYDDLVKIFPKADLSIDNTVKDMGLETSSEAKKDAELGEKNYRISLKREQLLNNIEKPEDIPNAIRKFKQSGYTVSFKDALLSDISIPMEVLNNMFYTDDKNVEQNIGNTLLTELDVVKDGVINEKDMQAALNNDNYEAFEANMDILVDAITNPLNPAFDLETTKSLIADYYVGSEDGSIVGLDQQAYDQIFKSANTAIDKKNNLNNPPAEEVSVRLTQELGYTTKPLADLRYNEVIAGNQQVQDWKGNIWEPTTTYDGIVFTSNEMFPGKKYTPEQLLASPHYGMYNYLVEYKGYKGTSTTPQEITPLSSTSMFKFGEEEYSFENLVQSTTPAESIASAINNSKEFQPKNKDLMLKVKDKNTVTVQGRDIDVTDPKDFNLLIEYINMNRKQYGDPLFELNQEE